MTVAEWLDTGNVQEASGKERGSLFSFKGDKNFIYEVRWISTYNYMHAVCIDDDHAFLYSFNSWDQIQPLTEEEAKKILSQA